MSLAFVATSPRARYALVAMSFPPSLCPSVVALVGAVSVVACATIEPAPPPLKPRDTTSAAGPSVAASASASASPSASPVGDGIPKFALAPRVDIEGAEPGQESLARAILTAAKIPMKECKPGGGGGTMRIRLKSDARSAYFVVDAGSSLDEAVRNCVLEALSTIDIPDTLSQSSPSSAAPKGFSSVITVQY